MYFLDLINKMQGTLTDELVSEIITTNLTSREYGLSLTVEAALEVVSARNQTLKDYGRVEINSEITQKIITAFCSSPYIQQDDYAATIIELIDLFHYIKNELDDTIGDEALIKRLADLYNYKCFGEMELLKGREADKIIRNYRFGYDEDEDDYDDEDEEDKPWDH